jgi:hypothetical protein
MQYKVEVAIAACDLKRNRVAWRNGASHRKRFITMACWQRGYDDVWPGFIGVDDGWHARLFVPYVSSDIVIPLIESGQETRVGVVPSCGEEEREVGEAGVMVSSSRAGGPKTAGSDDSARA